MFTYLKEAALRSSKFKDSPSTFRPSFDPPMLQSLNYQQDQILFNEMFYMLFVACLMSLKRQLFRTVLFYRFKN